MFTTAQVVTDFQTDTATKRQYFGVVTVPDGQPIPSVDLPQTGMIAPPVKGAIVLIWVHESNGAKFICTLSEPQNSASRMNVQIGGKPAMDPGEMQISPAVGGASILLNGNGGVHLTAGTLQDEIVIDNQRVKVAASEIDIHANPSVGAVPGLGLVRAHLGLDHSGSLHLGMQVPVFPTATSMSGFSVSPLGSVAMSAGPTLLPTGAVSVGILGGASLESGVGSGSPLGGLGSVVTRPDGNVAIASKGRSLIDLDILGGISIASVASHVDIGSYGGVFLGLVQRLVDERFMVLFANHLHGPGNTPTVTGPVIFPIAVPPPAPLEVSLTPAQLLQLGFAITNHTRAD